MTPIQSSQWRDWPLDDLLNVRACSTIFGPDGVNSTIPPFRPGLNIRFSPRPGLGWGNGSSKSDLCEATEHDSLRRLVANGQSMVRPRRDIVSHRSCSQASHRQGDAPNTHLSATLTAGSATHSRIEDKRRAQTVEKNIPRPALVLLGGHSAVAGHCVDHCVCFSYTGTVCYCELELIPVSSQASGSVGSASESVTVAVFSVTVGSAISRSHLRPSTRR